MMSFDANLLMIFCIVSFLVGSIPTGLIVARAKGVDLTKVGSGNIGATNVLRILGLKPALITLAGDIVKGILPVALVPLALSVFSLENVDYTLSFSGEVYKLNSIILFQAIVGLFAVLGHNFSLFLRFKGGKGVATSIGTMLAFSPHAGLLIITAWLITMRFSRISSLSALVSFALSPFFVYAIDPNREKLIFAFIITVLIFIRHKDNIVRLIKGSEPRFGRKK